MSQKSVEDTRLFATMVAKKQDWELNGDPSFLQGLLEGLKENYNRYGYFLCPCRDSDGSRETDKNSICPCRWAREDVPEYGHCYCGLYLSPAFAASGQFPGSIPDRQFGS